ncbi:MAG TPA: MopE-related protein, partial [Nannocystis sp.]
MRHATVHGSGTTRRTGVVPARLGLVPLSLLALAACPAEPTIQNGFTSATETGGGGSGTAGAETTTGAATETTSGATDGATTAAPEPTSSGSTTMSLTPCTLDEDCQDSPDGPVCDVETGTCGWPCEPGTQAACYDGPEGTEGKGQCAAGTKTCLPSGLGYGPCEGAILPADEVCGNGVDDDCDGTVDEDTDADGDGWGVCSGDCCDVPGAACLEPQRVNPGAYEFVGNAVDDDCDGMIDEAAPACDEGLQSDSSDPLDYARALDLCQTTTEDPEDPKDRTWGVISGKFSL